MALTLKQSQALTELANILYPFLPGKAHPYADQNLSFPGVASELNLDHHWPGGSKGPAITRLLTRTLESDSTQFCPLVLAVVQHGMIYRMNKEPVSRYEIDTLNTVVRRVDFKIPELHDPVFLDGLPRKVNSKTPDGDTPDPAAISQLQKQLTELNAIKPVDRGFGFEAFLSDLFSLFELTPRQSFRLTGEQIDGSFNWMAKSICSKPAGETRRRPIEIFLLFLERLEARRNGREVCLSATWASAKTDCMPFGKVAGQT